MSAAAKSLPTLNEVLSFTDEDLLANRSGRLSEGQKQRLTRISRRTLAILAGIVVVVGLAATLALFFAQRNGSAVLSLIGVLLTVINAVIVGIGAQGYLRTSSDVRGGKVTEISGVVSHTVRVSGRVAAYVLKLDGQEIIVPKPVFFAVEDGKHYRFYRAAASKTLLAAEAG
ncbi:MAG: hypothetical protein ABI835_03475 [Chloroflexota bacterium]